MSNAHYAASQNKMSGESCTNRRQHCQKKHPYRYHRVTKEVKKRLTQHIELPLFSVLVKNKHCSDKNNKERKKLYVH